MRITAAWYLLISCAFLLAYAGYVVVDQWVDAEGSDLALVLFLWILPCAAGIYLVLSTRLYRRSAPGSE